MTSECVCKYERVHRIQETEALRCAESLKMLLLTLCLILLHLQSNKAASYCTSYSSKQSQCEVIVLYLIINRISRKLIIKKLKLES